MAIFKQYKDILDELIDSSNPKSLNWAGPIDEKSYNALISKSNLADLLKIDCLDKDLFDK